MLDILTAEGLPCIRISDVQRVRFTNPVLEAELKRGLDVLALSHDTAKKAVQMHFSGDGERRVKVGYVIESPIWKTSYRLVLDKEGKPYLQGWAIVENTTDEDWNSVKMALVSGRPISFKMDLYNPLYIPRPTVEPELFASLRPPAYEGGWKDPATGVATTRLFKNQGRVSGAKRPDGDKEQLVLEGLNTAENQGPVVDADNPVALKLRRGRNPVGWNSASGGFTKDMAGEMAQRMDLDSVQSAASASKLGDFFQYTIDQPVNLPRKKSALLPIVGKEIEGTRVSIYNPAVQAKHPLLC
jgi:hypothetical protein